VSASLVIETGYRPGLVGRCVEMHARYYARTAGFGAAFESGVAGDLAEFVPRLENPDNAIWSARVDGRIAGCIAIDGQHADRPAHLRWFIVDEDLRDAGTGRLLLEEALAFCDRRGFARTELWTFAGLEAARRLYESHGFTKVEEQPGDRWGSPVTEQRYLRFRNAP
jgi:GNAT superfamily N-acetyltransferase